MHEGRIIASDSGWHLCPLDFAIQFVSSPVDSMMEEAAELASKVAKEGINQPALGRKNQAKLPTTERC